MSKKEDLQLKINEFNAMLNQSFSDEIYDKLMDAYEELDKIYYDENIDRFNEFCEKHINGKSRDEIDDATWDYYSDWHKDMYGHRP